MVFCLMGCLDSFEATLSGLSGSMPGYVHQVNEVQPLVKEDSLISARGIKLEVVLLPRPYLYFQPLLIQVVKKYLHQL